MSTVNTKMAHELRCVHWNCRRLTQTRLIELKSVIEEIQPDIVSVQEVKMNQEESNLYLRFENYSTYYEPRLVNPTFGGGVAILVRDTIPSSKINSFGAGLDYLGVKIETKNFSFNFVSHYAPDGTLRRDTVSSFCNLGLDLFLIGDLNARTPVVHCTALNPNGRVLEDILASDLDLCVLNDSTPTYFEDDREYTQVLDLMLCSSNLADWVMDAWCYLIGE